MNTDCEMLPKCGFMKKYESSKSLACKGFIANYCRGAKQTECKRREYKKINGVAPSDDMMPNGQMISHATDKF